MKIVIASTALVCAVACGAAPGRGGAEAAVAPDQRVLRVCADPNNLPYTNARLEGFENRLAEMIAADLGARVDYTWWPQRRGFIRKTLRAGACDVVLGVPTSFELAQSTRPYYRSGYVFVTRQESGLEIVSLDDPVLRKVKIGVQFIGDDYANTPPAHALARRGIVENVVGYSVYGDYSEESPPSRIIDAVAAGEIDVAIVWGPLAGYFSKRQATPLVLSGVTPQVDLPFLPFVFDIGVGVRRGEDALAAEIEESLERHRGAIDALLETYGVPRLDLFEEFDA
jgi:mxaJ protein